MGRADKKGVFTHIFFLPFPTFLLSLFDSLPKKVSLMPQPRVLILRAPGANCDLETQFAFEQAGAVAERVHIYRLREQPRLLLQYQILAIPGGFTYGDDVAAGK